MGAIWCPRCKFRGPISAVRHIAQHRAITDETGEPDEYGEWEFANPLRGTFLNCGTCGHSWPTRRELPYE